MSKLIFAFSTLLALITINGCATTTGNAPKISHSGFDGARVVTINGHGSACTSMLCTGLGAQWTSKNPNESILVVYIFNDIRGITGAQLNIDGKIYDLKSMESPTNFNAMGGAIKESSKGFIVPTELLRTIRSSQRTWLRVQTTKGYVEDAIIDGATDSKAYHALKRFLAAVDQS